jgi:DNA-binding NarL/FixJ family response regulator
MLEALTDSSVIIYETEPAMQIPIAIADDQQLFLHSLCTLVNTFTGFTVVSEALNGGDLLKKLEAVQPFPEIILLDVNMPGMDGPATARALSQKYPGIKMVALSIKDDDNTIISMLRAGCCAYLFKDIHPDELEIALEEISTKGFYNADNANINYRRLILHEQENGKKALTEKELLFLQLACSDLTYKQIANRMGLAERTIDGYRESVFNKFNVQSRVGMVIEGIRRNLATY